MALGWNIARDATHSVSVALWLLLIFVVLPFCDLYLLLVIGRVIGFWPTVALTLTTGILGGLLAKREGLRVWRRWREALAELRPPEEGIIDGILVFVGGALLITPGVLTDTLGFLLIIPVTRRLVATRIRRAVDRRIAQGQLHVVSTSSVFQGFDGFDPDPDPVQPGIVETSGESVDDDLPKLH